MRGDEWEVQAKLEREGLRYGKDFIITVRPLTISMESVIYVKDEDVAKKAAKILRKSYEPADDYDLGGYYITLFPI